MKKRLGKEVYVVHWVTRDDRFQGVWVFETRERARARIRTVKRSLVCIGPLRATYFARRVKKTEARKRNGLG